MVHDVTGGCPTSFGRFQGPVGPAGANATGALDGQERLLSAPPPALSHHGSQGER